MTTCSWSSNAWCACNIGTRQYEKEVDLLNFRLTSGLFWLNTSPSQLTVPLLLTVWFGIEKLQLFSLHCGVACSIIEKHVRVDCVCLVYRRSRSLSNTNPKVLLRVSACGGGLGIRCMLALLSRGVVSRLHDWNAVLSWWKLLWSKLPWKWGECLCLATLVALGLLVLNRWFQEILSAIGDSVIPLATSGIFIGHRT